MRERLRRILIILGTVSLNFGVDRVAKILAGRFLRGRGSLRVVGDLMVLVYAENRGAFLSLGNAWPPALKVILLLLLPAGVCIAGMVYLTRADLRLASIISLSSIIGGGLGNLTDRLINNFMVVDFINFGIGNFRTGILNAADLSVTFGTLYLLLDEFIFNKRKGG